MGLGLCIDFELWYH